MRAPEGARLADLETRRRWLSRPEIVRALPRTGLLVVDDTGAPAWAWDGAATTDAATGAVTTPDADAARALVALWDAGWAGQPSGAATVLLHDRGLFQVARPAGGPAPSS